jgi:VanZ family protein
VSNKKHGLGYALSTWLPVVLGVAVIAAESTELFGADHTSAPLRRIYEALFGRVSNGQWESIHHLIRKSGHFLAYGTIGLAWVRAWWRTLPHSRFLLDSLLALLGTGLIASADEWHQTYLPNRTGTPWDVLLDCCGVITLQLLAYLLMRTFKPKRLARAA